MEPLRCLITIKRSYHRDAQTAPKKRIEVKIPMQPLDYYLNMLEGFQAQGDELLVRWLVDDNQAFLAVDNLALRNFFAFLNPKYQTPHRDACRGQKKSCRTARFLEEVYRTCQMKE